MRGALVLLLAACGRFSFDPVGMLNSDGGDAVTGDGSGIDAPPCTFGPWGVPVNLASINSSANDYSPTLSDDGLEVVFESNRVTDTDEELFHSVRASTADAFPPPTILSVLNSPQDETAPSLTADRLGVYFTSTRTGAGRLYFANRATPTAAFNAPALVAELSTADVLGASISHSGQELFYTDTAENSIRRATRVGGVFTAQGVVAELGTNNARYQDLSRDGLTIYYENVGGELWEATRAAVGQPFMSPAQLPPVLQSTSTDSDPEVGDRDRAIVFASGRGTSQMTDLWMATRPCN